MRQAPGETVFINNLHSAEPLMHRWRRSGPGRANDGTDCGIRFTRRGWMITIPLVYGERFARRCHRCRWD